MRSDLNDELYIENDEICNKNDELFIENDGLCITNDEFCINNDEFCVQVWFGLPREELASLLGDEYSIWFKMIDFC